MDAVRNGQKTAFEPHPQCGIAVSINGKIYRDTWDQALPQYAETTSRIPGG